MDEMLEPCDGEWRGIGHIAAGSLQLKKPYDAYDARKRFALPPAEEKTAAAAPPDCIAGEIMRGLKQPAQCAHFGKACSPDHPLGAPMVSAEGVCAGYYRYKGQWTRDH
jgi:hydrogenase expression/formation protein HypD